MNRQQLVTFECIVREGSFSRAAQALDFSQAAVSGQMQALETEIGGPLFVRGARRATLTEAGENFLPYLRRALTSLDEGIEAAQGAHMGPRGRVTVGVIDTVDPLLVPVVTRFRAEYPHALLVIRPGRTAQILQDLADGIMRLGLVTWSYLTGTVEVEVLARFREPLIAVVAPTHPLAGHPPLTVDDLVREGAPFHQAIWGTPEDARIAPMSGRGFDLNELPHSLMHQLIVQGMGAGFFPITLVADDLAAGRLVALPLVDADGLVRELALVRHAQADALPAATCAFVELVRAEVAAVARSTGLRVEWTPDARPGVPDTARGRA